MIDVVQGICSVPGCDQRVKARGWCDAHYRRWRTYGDPAASRPSPIERFRSSFVEDESGCWLWQMSLAGGYGRFSVGTRRSLAHRWSYEFHVGPIPEGTELDHLCRNPGCVKPAHLEAVTHRENMRRSVTPSGVNARKTHCQSGHEFTPENTMLKPDGRRSCRECFNAWTRAWRKQKSEGARAFPKPLDTSHLTKYRPTTEKEWAAND